MPRLPPIRSILVNGTVGVGKSTTADAIGAVLTERGIPHAVIDLDTLRRAWPAPSDDPFHEVLQFANLEDVVRNYRRAGVETFVLAGVVESGGALADHRRIVGDSLAVIRLRLPVDVIRSRLRVRHDGDEPGLGWHLHRAGELPDILEAAALDDAIVDTEGMTPRQVADRIVHLATR